jgi:hypothetical protein
MTGEQIMANETKTGTSRKSSTETKSPAPKAVKKAATKTAAATGKTAAKTTAKKASAPPAKTEKPVAKRTASPRKAKSTGQPITADARLRHIEVAAYYIAERSGFSRNPADCWVAAESEVDGLLLSGRL